MKKSACKKIYVTIALALLFIFPVLLTAQNLGEVQLRAGAAKVDITPDESDLVVATDSIRDPLYVRAIVVEDGSTCAVLVGVDMGMVGTETVNDAINRTSQSVGCPAENWVITATHTHSSNTDGFRGPPLPETIADAIVEAAATASSQLKPARVGYGTTQVDLNVNRDNYNQWLEWRQEPNPDGVSDKTLAVMEFLGEDDVPIAVYMNYGMHPVNFFLNGVISADFPGEASRYFEELFNNQTVALFTQAASGDQNPKLAYTPVFTTGQVKAVLPPHEPPNQGAPRPALQERQPIPDEDLATHRKMLERKGDYVEMMGTLIGTSAMRVMLYDMQPKEEASIWGAQQTITCPGRVRLDTSKRENYDPGYEDGPDVNIKVGLLRIGDIHLVTVNGEVYTDIGMHLKEEAPAANTMFVTLANGAANSGYIYSDDATYHQTFQVLGSRLQPGCAEEKIVSTALDLMHQAGQ